MYQNEIVQPMKEELNSVGFKELFLTFYASSKFFGTQILPSFLNDSDIKVNLDW